MKVKADADATFANEEQIRFGIQFYMGMTVYNVLYMYVSWIRYDLSYLSEHILYPCLFALLFDHPPERMRSLYSDSYIAIDVNLVTIFFITLPVVILVSYLCNICVILSQGTEWRSQRSLLLVLVTSDQTRINVPSRARTLWAKQGLCKQIRRERESYRESERATESQRGPEREPARISVDLWLDLSLSGSLFLALCEACIFVAIVANYAILSQIAAKR